MKFQRRDRKAMLYWDRVRWDQWPWKRQDSPHGRACPFSRHTSDPGSLGTALNLNTAQEMFQSELQEGINKTTCTFLPKLQNVSHVTLQRKTLFQTTLIKSKATHTSVKNKRQHWLTDAQSSLTPTSSQEIASLSSNFCFTSLPFYTGNLWYRGD